MRSTLALVMLAHGLAHLVGFASLWRLSEKLPYRTTILSGHLDVGDDGARVFGALWLTAAAAFATVAIAFYAHAPWSPAAAYAIAGASLVLCVLSLPDAKIGLAFNAVLLVVIAVGTRTGWFAAA